MICQEIFSALQDFGYDKPLHIYKRILLSPDFPLARSRGIYLTSFVTGYSVPEVGLYNQEYILKAKPLQVPTHFNQHHSHAI